MAVASLVLQLSIMFKRPAYVRASVILYSHYDELFSKAAAAEEEEEKVGPGSKVEKEVRREREHSSFR